MLGHGGLATTDVPFTATFLLALLALLRWIEEPTRGRAIAAGLALGLAGATKFSALMLPVIAVLAALARRSLGPRPGSARRLLTQAPLAAVGATLVVWAAYRFAVAAPATLWRPEWLQETVNACFPSDRGRRAAAWLLAHRLPGAGRLPGGAGPVRPGGPGTIDRLPARPPDAGRIPGLLPDRDRREAAAAPARAGALRLSSRSLRGRATPELRFRALAPLLAIAVYLAMVIPSRTNIGVAPRARRCSRCWRAGGAGRRPLWQAVARRVAARAADRRGAVWALAIPFAAAPDYFPGSTRSRADIPNASSSTAISTGARTSSASNARSPQRRAASVSSRTSAPRTSAGTSSPT